MSSHAEQLGKSDSPARGFVSFLVIAPIAAFGAACWILGGSAASWIVFFADAIWPGVIIASAAGLGSWPASWLGFAATSRFRFWCTATALGTGVLGAATLAAAAAGVLTRPVATGFLAVGIALGIWWQCRRARAAPGTQVEGECDRRPHWALRVAWLAPLAVPLAVMVHGATLPPGILWTGEARGYDVLEYHLQVPREYFEAGRLLFLPHNVYASFPQQVEILYLLLMHLHGDAHDAAIPAQLLHAALGVLAAVTVAAWSPPGWSRVLALLVFGTVPWLAYLGCLAYVELGMLFFAAACGGIVWAGLHGRLDLDWRSVLAAGLCAGWAGGCKYTAIAFVAGSVLLASLVAVAASSREEPHGTPPRRRRAVARLLAFGAGMLVTLAPWLIRNAVLSGNPIYPFAYRWLDGKAWSVAQAEQWAQAHRLPPEASGLKSRAQIAFDELLRSGMYGPGIWLLALAAIALTRSRRVLFPVTWVLVVLLAWALTTRMPGRFAIVVTVPLALLASELAATAATARNRLRAQVRCFACLSAAAVAAIIGDCKLLWLWQTESRTWQARTGIPLAQMAGRVDLMQQANLINPAVGQGPARLWLIGESRVFYLAFPVRYTVVFSRDPWLEFCAGAEPDASVAFLRSQGITHVVFSWSEIERLRRTYGFSPAVTRQWAAGLAAAGLRSVFRECDAGGDAVIEVYEVVPG